jgi:alanine-glyoxylate transaminase/(R)-3-amino-2-methylpropionate-pyruvate transaminase
MQRIFSRTKETLSLAGGRAHASSLSALMEDLGPSLSFSWHRDISTRSLETPSISIKNAQTMHTRSHSTEAPPMPPCDYSPPLYTGPAKDEVMALRKEFMNPAIFHFYKDPVMITHGHNQWLFDETGKRYLDCFAGIVTVSCGHCHPLVDSAVEEQLRKLQHTTTIYLNDQVASYAKELASRMPEGSDLKVCYFVNSGTEANELAFLLARLYSKNYDMIALRNAYHGISQATSAALGLSTWKHNTPTSFGVHHAIHPDGYRGPFGSNVEAYVNDLKDVIRCSTSGHVAGFVHETIQGVGGAVPLMDGYLPEVYEYVRAHGGLCIADEVQTGFGRTGTKYFGFENHGVVPDIVTMAKGIGNGLPLGAVVTTPQIARALADRLHFNTFGGNPVVMAGARAVLRAIDADGLQENSHLVGEYMLDRLNALQEKHDIIGDVRGKGLMIGVELVKDRLTKEPAVDETAKAFDTAKDSGVLLGKGGLNGNVFRIKPPMCFSKADADYLVAVLDLCLQKL